MLQLYPRCSCCHWPTPKHDPCEIQRCELFNLVSEITPVRMSHDGCGLRTSVGLQVATAFLDGKLQIIEAQCAWGGRVHGSHWKSMSLRRMTRRMQNPAKSASLHPTMPLSLLPSLNIHWYGQPKNKEAHQHKHSLCYLAFPSTISYRNGIPHLLTPSDFWIDQKSLWNLPFSRNENTPCNSALKPLFS